MDVLYIRHDDKTGVLSENEKRVVLQIINTDLTIVHDKRKDMTYLLVPLTKSHAFEYHGDWLMVDGKRFDSCYYFRKDGAQWIAVDEVMLRKVA